LNDIIGEIMRNVYRGEEGIHIIERDDGFESQDLGSWFDSSYDDWPDCQKEPLRFVKGRILDIGCGMGRVALHLQAQGHDVVGIDISPTAIDLCQQRGLRDARVMSAAELEFPEEYFTTIILYGNNFGVLGEPKAVVSMLKEIHKITTKDAVILAETIDPENLTNPIHVKYHESNKNKGNLPGLWRIRTKYKEMVGDWHNILFVSPELMKEMAIEAGWLLEQVIGERDLYVGILKKV